MPHPCRLVGSYDEANAIGDMFFIPEERIFTRADPDGVTRCFCFGFELSEEYVTQRKSIRRPLMVILPSHGSPNGQMWFCIDSAYTDNPPGQRHGWAVSGEPPTITVSPSIDAGPLYHGFLVNGMISDG